MRKSLFLLLGVLIGLGASATQAQAQLNTRDRLLLYYNYYQNQQNSKQLMRNQQQIRSSVTQFRDLQNQLGRERRDPFERYVRGRTPEHVSRPLPRIYSGGGQGAGQYFMRMPQFGTHFEIMR